MDISIHLMDYFMIAVILGIVKSEFEVDSVINFKMSRNFI